MKNDYFYIVIILLMWFDLKVETVQPKATAAVMSTPQKPVEIENILNIEDLEEDASPNKEIQETPSCQSERISPLCMVKKPEVKINFTTDSLPVSVKAYVDRFYRVAQMEQKKYGIPSSITLGQGLLESDKGNSKLAREANNHFGIKCRDFGDSPIQDLVDGCLTHRDKNKHGEVERAKFLMMKSAWASFRAHSIVLQSARYKRLYAYGNDYRKWSYGLQECGYAVDKKYGDKLINIIEKYKLYEYDVL